MNALEEVFRLLLEVERLDREMRARRILFLEEA